MAATARGRALLPRPPLVLLLMLMLTASARAGEMNLGAYPAEAAVDALVNFMGDFEKRRG